LFLTAMLPCCDGEIKLYIKCKNAEQTYCGDE